MATAAASSLAADQPTATSTRATAAASSLAGRRSYDNEASSFTSTLISRDWWCRDISVLQ
jgi:hypothetical protein